MDSYTIIEVRSSNQYDIRTNTQFVARSTRTIGDQVYTTDSPKFLRRQWAEDRGDSYTRISDAVFRYEARLYPPKNY